MLAWAEQRCLRRDGRSAMQWRPCHASPSSASSHRCCDLQTVATRHCLTACQPAPAPADQPAPMRSPFAVVPVLMQGMMELNRKRPADPIEFLCAFLQQHNPKKQQKTN